MNEDLFLYFTSQSLYVTYLLSLPFFKSIKIDKSKNQDYLLGHSNEILQFKHTTNKHITTCATMWIVFPIQHLI